MDNLNAALGMVRQNCYMASIDLADSYYTVPAALSDQKYLVFNFEGQLYKYVCLPNGLSSAPRIFTKLMKPVFSALRKKGHQIMGYLDDSILMGDTFEECGKVVVASVELLTKLGFQINPEKSRLLPVQVIEYLVFFIDSVTMTVRLTPLKRQKVLSIISEIISSKSLLIRDLAKLLGTLESTLPGVQFGRLHMWHLQQDKNEALRNSQGNYNSPCKLSDNSYKELKWWVENLPNCFNPIRKFLPKSVVYSDACPNGWRAAFEDQSTEGLWTPKEAELHINVSETAAAYFALKLFCKDLKNTAVHLKVDNTATVAFINKQKAPNKVVFTIIKKIWEFCIQRNLWLFASYIKSTRNKVADAESRKLRDNLEWSLHDTLFGKITAKFGKPDIDLFASRANFKVVKYISYYPDPDATGVDAFATSWSDLQFYAFPLFAIISKVISKIENEKAEGILVVPIFTTQIWFPRVMRLLIDYPLLLPDSNKSLFFPYRMEKAPVLPTMKLMACHVSGTLSKGLDFQKRLQTYSCSPGEMEQKLAMQRVSKNGCSFVLHNRIIPIIPIKNMCLPFCIRYTKGTQGTVL